MLTKGEEGGIITKLSHRAAEREWKKSRKEAGSEREKPDLSETGPEAEAKKKFKKPLDKRSEV